MSILSTRSTRGRRFHRVIEEEAEADEEFWNQDFFREEVRDSDYQSESEEEDIADTDFSDNVLHFTPNLTLSRSPPVAKPVSMMNHKNGQSNPLDYPLVWTLDLRRKRRVPPGSEKKGSKSKQTGRQGRTKEEDETKSTEVTLRASTLRRRSEAERERLHLERQREKRRLEQVKEKVKPTSTTTLQEFLREAAEMEIINLASLNELEIFEEESKKRAMQTKSVYTGPSIKTRSRVINGEEKTVLELRSIRRIPDWLRHKSKAPEPSGQFCVVTGLPARYRDPVTKLPYATIDAFREIRRIGSIDEVHDIDRSDTIDKLNENEQWTSIDNTTT
eukprot:g5511.t1